MISLTNLLRDRQIERDRSCAIWHCAPVPVAGALVALSLFD
jgi:hypothetical protein